jgi:hypothetical protein
MGDRFQGCGGYGCADERVDDWAAVVARIDAALAEIPA